MRHASAFLSVFGLCLLLAACTAIGGKDAAKGKTESALLLKPSSFRDLAGWGGDAPSEALPALQKSCTRIVKRDPSSDFGPYAGKTVDWQEVCNRLSVYLLATNAEAAAFFEENFTPYEVHGDAGAEGLFTGYYEPMLQGARERKPPYLIPLHARPDDLVTVNLGDFRPELKGETIMGRVAGENLVPYHLRAEIEAGALEGQKKEIVWVDDAVDAFFLHIQGSGQVRMEDGSILRVGYAAQNGHPYFAIGKALVEKGALTKETVSMQSIRDWLEAHPDEAADVMNLNASYVFFTALEGEGPLGAEGVALTPRRSLAVDRKRHSYGTPVWIDADEPEGGARLQRLMIAQDTGGAIRGAVRGDFFWGGGDMAAHKAGLMKSKGRMWVLLPKSVTPPEQNRWTWWKARRLSLRNTLAAGGYNE